MLCIRRKQGLHGRVRQLETVLLQLRGSCCRAFEKVLKPGHTRLVMLESPTNPRMQICDIRRLVDLSHEVESTNLYADGILVGVTLLVC